MIEKCGEIPQNAGVGGDGNKGVEIFQGYLYNVGDRLRRSECGRKRKGNRQSFPIRNGEGENHEATM